MRGSGGIESSGGKDRERVEPVILRTGKVGEVSGEEVGKVRSDSVGDLRGSERKRK